MGARGRGLPRRGGQWERGGAGPGPRHVRARTCPRGAAAGGAGPGPGPGTERPGRRNSDPGTGTAILARGQRPRHADTGTGTALPAQGHRDRHGKRGQRYRHRHRDTHRDRNGDGDTGTAIPALGQGREQRHRHRDSGTSAAAPGAGGLGRVTLQQLNPGRGSSGGAMEPPARACSCGSPASDSEAEVGSSPRSPPRSERSRKRPAGLDRAPPESPPSPHAGKRPRKGEGGDAPPSDGDRLFAQKCRELQGFIRPLAELLEGLRRGRYDRGLSSFQQSVAMDRLQRIIGVLQKPEMGARYLGTLLQVEAMLRLWFPHVAPKPALDPAPPAAPPRRRPPAGPPGAPRCRRPPGDLALGSAAGPAEPRQQRGSPPCPAGAPEPPPAPDV